MVWTTSERREIPAEAARLLDLQVSEVSTQLRPLGFKLRQPSASLTSQLGRDVKNLLDDSVFLGEFLQRDAGPAAAMIWQLPHRPAFHADGQTGVVRRWEPLW